MLALAIAYSVIYQGPWGRFKDWANVAETRNWIGFAIYAASLWTLSLAVIPGIFILAVQLGRKLAGASSAGSAAPVPPFKDVFLSFVYPLVPLGLLAWVTFSLPLVLVNGSYILMVISDPFGWGWDLFRTSNIAWTPLVPHWAPYIQVPLLWTALYFAITKGYAHARRLFGSHWSAVRAFAPVSVVLTGCVIFFLWLYVS
jgi:hypothetical protein